MAEQSECYIVSCYTFPLVNIQLLFCMSSVLKQSSGLIVMI